MNNFTIDDIRVGMLIVLSNGAILIVNSVDINKKNCMIIGTTEVTKGWDKSFGGLWPLADINEVWSCPDNTKYVRDLTTKHRTLLWKRVEVKTFTIEEIENILGVKIKIVNA